MDTIETLATRAPSVRPDMTCSEVFELFSSDHELVALAVVKQDRPVGLINRHRLTLKLAGRFGRPLYENKPITRLMDTEPLIIEFDQSMAFLSQLILDRRPSALDQGFIVTKHGQYLGIGTALSMLQANMERAKIRSAELERAKVAAETANRTKSMFLANMSHELRTPLNAIIGFTDFMRAETLGKIQPSEYADYINDVNESGKHLLNVINAILDMSKVEANRLELHEDYVDPEEVVSTVVRMMSRSAQKRGIEVVVNGLEGLPDLYADRQLLRQILLNLLSNALKFSGDGKRIEINLSVVESGHFVFSVIDQGIGIAPADLERVMEPFRQAEGYLSRSEEGTGLGLPLCQALIKAHGGRLDLSSVVDKGTRVDVCLPPERVVGLQSADDAHHCV